MSFFNGRSQGTVLAGALLAAAVAACQPLPRPFSPAGGDRHGALLEQSDHGGIVVLAISGVSDPVAFAMAARMSKALRDLNVPAATGGGNRKSRFLQGWASEQPGDAGRVSVEVVWDLFDANGAVIGSHTVRRETVPYRWVGGDRGLLDELATAAAPRIVALLQGPPIADKATALHVPLHVAAVTGAPGDGKVTLRRAMRSALGRVGFRLAEAPAPGGLVIAGRVRLAPPHAGRQEVEINWSVQRPDGAELGKLVQRNTVPAGSLDGPWGGTANAIADSVVDGVRDLLSRLAPDVLR